MISVEQDAKFKMDRAAQIRQQKLHEIFINREHKNLDEEEEDQGDLDDAISLDKTIRKRLQPGTGLTGTHKVGTGSRYLSDSRTAGFQDQDLRIAQAADGENVRKEIYNIERKLQMAHVKRENFTKNQVENALNYKNKLNSIKQTKEAILSRQEWETMNKVILKHHEKDINISKRARDKLFM